MNKISEKEKDSVQKSLHKAVLKTNKKRRKEKKSIVARHFPTYRPINIPETISFYVNRANLRTYISVPSEISKIDMEEEEEEKKKRIYPEFSTSSIATRRCRRYQHILTKIGKIQQEIRKRIEYDLSFQKLLWKITLSHVLPYSFGGL
ncbi:hypothetical protein ANTPLA_LOCUS5729 [Anthophora plagiata]